MLANSFRRYDICLEKDGLLKEITWRRLAKDMQMEMMEKEIMMEKEYVTVGEFIKTVRERGLVVEDVQKRLANSCYYF